MRKILGIMVLAAAAAGCLQKETTHTLYLSPDGKVTWMAVEADVHSDETDPARRLAEEQKYLVEAAGDIHAVGRGLAALDPITVNTRIVRRDRPFFVITEARYDSIEFLAKRMLNSLPAKGNVSMTSGERMTLTIRVDVRSTLEGGQERESPLDGLMEDLDRYQIVLTDGRFEWARGFKLDDDRRRARPVEMTMEEITENGGILELSLTWTR